MISLAPLHTFALAYTTLSTSVINTTKQLASLIQQQQLSPQSYVLGQGTNVVFSEDFTENILLIRTKGIQLTEYHSHYELIVSAGESWNHVVHWTHQRQLYGLENLVDIPGTIGAAPIQNIGAYGADFSQFCLWVEAIDRRNGQINRFYCHECHFGYRHSLFKQQTHWIVTTVALRLEKQPHLINHYQGLEHCLTAQQVYQHVHLLRQQKLPDPKKSPNAGSFFMNPVVATQHVIQLQQEYPNLTFYPINKQQAKLSAAWLIEASGCKGQQIGGIKVSTQHALVLEHVHHGSGQDLLALIQLIQTQVWQRFTVFLQPEVKVIGANGELQFKPL